MARHRYQRGIRFKLNGEWYLVDEILSGGNLSLENQSLGGKVVKSIVELNEAFFAGNLLFEVKGPRTKISQGIEAPVQYTIQDLEFLNDKTRKKIWQRYEIIRAVLTLPDGKRGRRYIEEFLRDLREGNKGFQPKNMVPSRASVERWLKNYIESGQDIRSLVDGYVNSGGKGRKRLNEEIENIISTVLDDLSRNQRYRTINDVYALILNRISVENRTRPQNFLLSPPSRLTVYKRIKDRGVDLILRRRPSRIEHQITMPVQQGPRPTRILERVQFDSTQLDVIVVDEMDGMPIGRPTLSFALDVYSAYPLGFYLGFEPPSYQSTMNCAYHAFSMKPDVRVLYGTKNLWVAHGLPETAIIDNGKEYVNTHLQEAFGMLGINVEQNPVRSPWMKGAVERHFRTMNSGLFHALPGSTFSNILKRGDYDSEDAACISLETMKQVLHIFLLDVYSQKWNDGVNGVPEGRWNSSLNAGFIPALPSNLEELKIMLFRKEKRTLQRAGIEYENISYQSSDLLRLRTLLKRGERQVSIRVNPDDLRSIYVLDPEDNQTWLRFFANDKYGYTENLSLWKHRIVRKFLNLQKSSSVDIYALADAKVAIQKIVDAEYIKNKRKIKRKPSARFNQTPGISNPDSDVLSQGFSLSSGIISAETRELDEKLGNTAEEVNIDTQIESSKKSKSAKKRIVVEKTPDESVVDNIDDNDESGWGADYGLPQDNN